MDRPVRRMYIVEKRRIGYNRFHEYSVAFSITSPVIGKRYSG